MVGARISLRKVSMLGRTVFGLSAMGIGIISIHWHQVHSLGGLSHPAFLPYLAGIVELTGGIAVLRRKTARPGAVILGIVFTVFSFYWIPYIVRAPLEFAWWGNFFEQFSILLGAVFIFSLTIADHPEIAATIQRVAYVSYGISVVTYALYQLFYLKYTASLVPVWIPPGQMFWAVATTIAFALAAVALLSNRSALLASGLLTAMLILFGLLIWVPACILHPHKMSNWTEDASNFAMAGTAWLVTEYIWKNAAGSKREVQGD